MDYRPAVILCVDASGSTDRSSRELIDAAIAAQNGKRIESPDYGVLAEFALAAVAIRAAQDAHDAVSVRNAGLRRNRRTVLRVGVHIGEVTVDGDELQGEGVDVARRLAGIAEPGGIAISEATHNQVQGRVKLPFKRLEDRAIDTHGGPVRVWHWQSADPGAAAKQAPSFIAKAVALLDPEKSAVKRDRETQREIARDADDSMAAEASRSGGREATSQIKATETAPKDEAEKPLDRGAVQRKPKPTDPEYRYNALLLWSLVLLIGALVTWYYVTQESADPRVSAREDIEDPSGFLRTAPSDRPIQGDRTSLGGTASSGRVAEPGGDALPKPSRSVIDDYNLPQLTIAPRAGESSKLAAEQYGGGASDGNRIRTGGYPSSPKPRSVPAKEIKKLLPETTGDKITEHILALADDYDSPPVAHEKIPHPIPETTPLYGGHTAIKGDRGTASPPEVSHGPSSESAGPGRAGRSSAAIGADNDANAGGGAGLATGNAASAEPTVPVNKDNQPAALRPTAPTSLAQREPVSGRKNRSRISGAASRVAGGQASAKSTESAVSGQTGGGAGAGGGSPGENGGKGSGSSRQTGEGGAAPEGAAEPGDRAESGSGDQSGAGSGGQAGGGSAGSGGGETAGEDGPKQNLALASPPHEKPARREDEALPEKASCPTSDPQETQIIEEAQRRWETAMRMRAPPRVIDAITIAETLLRVPATKLSSTDPVQPWRRLSEPNINLSIVFDFDLATIKPIALVQLEEVGKALKSPKLRPFKMLIEGHTDNVGSEQYNESRSLRRAAASREMLVSLFSIPSDRLSIKGMGETAPIDTNETAAGRHRNRRVTFINYDFSKCSGPAG